MSEYKEIINKIKPELDKTISFLNRELLKIRTGRASISLVEDIIVDCFGQKLPLKQLATISLSEPRQIVIQPWDNSYIEPIVAAISRHNLGAFPVVDKNLIRLSLPPPSQELRKDLEKLISQKMEEAKRTVRRWREEAWDEIQERFKEGKIREDDKYRGKDELQDLVNEYNEKIKEMGEKKKREVME